MELNGISVDPLHALELASILIRFVVHELQNNLSVDFAYDKIPSFRNVNALILDPIGSNIQAAGHRGKLIEIYVQAIGLIWVLRELDSYFVGQLLQD